MKNGKEKKESKKGKKGKKGSEDIKPSNDEKTTDAPINESDGTTGKGNDVSLEKEKLLDLYKTLKDLSINSIGDLEVKISRL